MLDSNTRALTEDGALLPTEPQVFDVLSYLVEHRERAVAKTELLDEVWGDRFVSESALTSRIKTSRSLLGDNGRAQRMIRTIHGFGYQYVGPASVEEEGSSATAQTGGTANGETSATAGFGAGDNTKNEAQADSVQTSPEVLLAHTIAVDDITPFVGRQAELASLTAVLTEPGQHQIFIGGQPGFGKSRLAIEAVGAIEAKGVVVCGGRSSQRFTSAFQPLRDAVTHLASAWPGDFRRWSLGLEPILCGLAPSLGGLLNATPTNADAYAAGDVLVTLLERITRDQPLIVLIDDLQWSDEPTRALLGRFTRRFPDLPLTVLGTYRTNAGDLPTEVRRWIAEQVEQNGATKLSLDKLPAEEAIKLAGAVLGDQMDEDLSAVVELTGGHCFFLVETLRDVQRGAAVTDSIERLITGRLERLPEPAARFVRAAAFLGVEFSFHIAGEVAELTPVEALEAVDSALSSDLLHETSSLDRFRFSHRLVPDAIRADMSRPARAGFHHRCVDAITAADGDEVEIAVHLLESVPLIPLEAAVARSRAIAENAHAVFDFDRSARLLERILETEPGARVRAELLIEIGSTLHHAGRGVAAASHFEQAADIGRANGWTDILVDAALGHYGRSPYRNLVSSTTMDLLREADELLGTEPSKDRAMIMAKTAAFSLFSLRLAERAELSGQAIVMAENLAEELTPSDRLHLLETRSVVFGCPAGVDEVERIEPNLGTLRIEAGVLMADAAAPEVAPYFRADGALLRRERDAFDPADALPGIWEWRNLQLTSLIAAMEGDIVSAREHCDAAGRIGQAFWGESSPVLHGLGQLFCDAISGDWNRSLEMFQFLHAVNESPLIAAPFAWSLARNGDLASARKTLASIRIESFSWFSEHMVGGHALIAAAEAATLVEDLPRAAAIEEALTEVSELLLGLPWAGSFAAAHSLSKLLALRGESKMAEEYKTMAHQVYNRAGAPALAALLN